MKKLRYLVFILVAISNILMTMGRIDFYKSDYIKNRFLHRDSQTYILRPKDHLRMSSDYPNELREYSAGLDIKRVGYSFDRGSQSANIDIYNIGEEGHSSKKEKVMGYNINTYGGDDILDLPPEGRYIITGDEKDISAFIEKYNKYLGTTSILEKSSFFGSIGAYSYYGVSYREIGILLVLISIAILKIISDSKLKDTSVYSMFGYSSGRMVYRMSSRDVVGIVLCSVISMVLCMVYFLSRYGKVTDYYVDALRIGVSIAVILSIFNLLFSLLLVVKGRWRLYNIVSRYISVNTLFIFVASVLFVLFSSGLMGDVRDLIHSKKDYDYMKDMNNYASAEMYDPSIDLGDHKYYDEYHKKMLKLWNIANKEGAIMISPGNKYKIGLEQYSGRGYIDGEVYINNNYLDNVVIKDENGNRIRNIKDDKYTVTVIVPNKYKGNKEVIKDIRYTHMCSVSSDYIAAKTWNLGTDPHSYEEYARAREEVMEDVEKFLGKDILSKMKEKIIYIDDSQKFYSYSLEYPVDENQVPTGKPIMSPIAYVLNGENFRDLKKYGKETSDGSIYYVAPGNTYLKFKISDYEHPEKDIIPLAKKAGQDYSNLRIMKLGDGVNQKLNEMKMKIFMYSFVSITSVIVMMVLVDADIQKYLYFNRKTISVKYYLGFSRFKIFRLYMTRYIFKGLLTFFSLWFIKTHLHEFIEYHFNYYIGLDVIFKVAIVMSLVELAYVASRLRLKNISCIDMK